MRAVLQAGADRVHRAWKLGLGRLCAFCAASPLHPTGKEHRGGGGGIQAVALVGAWEKWVGVHVEMPQVTQAAP